MSSVTESIAEMVDSKKKRRKFDEQDRVEQLRKNTIHANISKSQVRVKKIVAEHEDRVSDLDDINDRTNEQVRSNIIKAKKDIKKAQERVQRLREKAFKEREATISRLQRKVKKKREKIQRRQKEISDRVNSESITRQTAKKVNQGLQGVSTTIEKIRIAIISGDIQDSNLNFDDPFLNQQVDEEVSKIVKSEFFQSLKDQITNK